MKNTEYTFSNVISTESGFDTLLDMISDLDLVVTKVITL